MTTNGDGIPSTHVQVETTKEFRELTIEAVNAARLIRTAAVSDSVSGRQQWTSLALHAMFESFFGIRPEDVQSNLKISREIQQVVLDNMAQTQLEMYD